MANAVYSGKRAWRRPAMPGFRPLGQGTLRRKRHPCTLHAHALRGHGTPPGHATVGGTGAPFMPTLCEGMAHSAQRIRVVGRCAPGAFRLDSTPLTQRLPGGGECGHLAW